MLVDIVRGEVWRYHEEDTLRSLQRVHPHRFVIGRTLDNLHLTSHFRGDPGRLTRDDPYRLPGGDKVFDELRADVPCWRGDDDHGGLPSMNQM